MYAAMNIEINFENSGIAKPTDVLYFVKPGAVQVISAPTAFKINKGIIFLMYCILPYEIFKIV